MEVDCSVLLADRHSQFKFLCVITPQFFLHVCKIVAFSPLLLIYFKNYSILFLFCR